MPPQAEPARILLTRPADQGARFAAALRQAFGGRVEVMESPMLSMRYLAPDLPAVLFSAVVFTSETAVDATRALHRELPARAFAVGERTAAAARAAGFDAVSAGGDADALVALLTAADPGPVLHLHGAETRGEVVPRLRAAGLRAEGVTVYVQEPQALSAATLAWLADTRPVIAPLFSPRTATLFSAAAHGAAAQLWLVSLSPAVDAAATCPAACRRTALRPDAAHMLKAVSALLDNPSGP